MEELTIILLGKQGAGKSASGNILLNKHPFHTVSSPQRVTQACSMSISSVDEQKITVIDTPGWCDPSQPSETEIKNDIIEFVNRQMPHVFLLVLPVGRFTTEEITTVMNILKEFGDEVTKYMIVLFTKGDELEENPVENYLKELHSYLRSIIKLCGGRYHVFNNRNKKDRQQVSSLLKKMNEMVGKNEEKRYTAAMYNMVKNTEVENSVPENGNNPAEKEKRDDGQERCCDAGGKEKGEREQELLDYKKENEKLKKNIDSLWEYVMNMEREFKTKTENIWKRLNENHHEPLQEQMF